MALLYSIEKEMGTIAKPFLLKGTDDRLYSLESFTNAKALCVVFMCNHCPYVIATIDRINFIAKSYATSGLQMIGINPNDVLKYPADSFENMKVFAKTHALEFPYVIDESQEIAKAYDAVCTPDIYVYKNDGGTFKLAYHGRIDDNWKEPEKATTQELKAAIDDVLAGREVQLPQIPSMGCSIKWK